MLDVSGAPPEQNAMSDPIFDDPRFIAEILDTFPAPTLVVDDDVRILFASRAAREYLGLDTSSAHAVLLQRGGHVLHCVNADAVLEGCGRAEACRRCVIRNSVRAAFETGSVQRAKAFMQLRRGDEIVDRYFLVSTSAVHWEARRVALVTIEDISELMQLKSILPVCMSCGRVRDERGDWKNLSVYLKEQADVDVTHGLCATCLERNYPE
jgi:PAS domain-containing protein